MNIIQLSNPTNEQYECVKSYFGDMVNESQFLQSHKIDEPKCLRVMADMNVCRFNMIHVAAMGEYVNPDCVIKEVEFEDFMINIRTRLRPFTSDEEIAWRNDLSNKTARQLLTEKPTKLYPVFTQGEWTEIRAVYGDGCYCASNIVNDKKRICDIYGAGFSESNANAALISAAPDMFNALSDLYYDREMWSNLWESQQEYICRVLNKATKSGFFIH